MHSRADRDQHDTINMNSQKVIEYVVMGFVRENENECKVIIPNDIKLLMLLFYPNIIKYKGKFIAMNAGSGIRIDNDYKFTGYRAAKLDNPLPILIDCDMITNIRYSWKAKITGNDYGFLTSYIFGVVSNRCKNFGEYPNQNLTDSFGISLEKSTVFFNGIQRDQQYEKVIKFGEIIVMQYEIDNINGCKLYFYKQTDENDTNSLIPIYSMDLPQNKEITNWYPVFSKPGYMNSFIVVIPWSD